MKQFLSQLPFCTYSIMGMLLSVGFVCPASAHDPAETLYWGWAGTDVHLSKVLLFSIYIGKAIIKHLSFFLTIWGEKDIRCAGAREHSLKLQVFYWLLSGRFWQWPVGSWPVLPLFHTWRVESIERGRLTKALLTHKFGSVYVCFSRVSV